MGYKISVTVQGEGTITFEGDETDNVEVSEYGVTQYWHNDSDRKHGRLIPWHRIVEVTEDNWRD